VLHDTACPVYIQHLEAFAEIQFVVLAVLAGILYAGVGFAPGRFGVFYAALFLCDAAVGECKCFACWAGSACERSVDTT
jgi:hypothetical protein